MQRVTQANRLHNDALLYGLWLGVWGKRTWGSGS